MICRKHEKPSTNGYVGVLHNVCCVIEASAKQNTEILQDVQFMGAQQSYTEEENKLFNNMKDLNVVLTITIDCRWKRNTMEISITMILQLFNIL